MKKPHQVFIKSVFALLGLYPAQRKKYVELLADRASLDQMKTWWELLKRIPDEKASFFAKNLEFSRSQFYQDLFVASELSGKRGGFFIEAGACDGLRLSNSAFLENHLGWHGVLVEPGKFWHRKLKENRKALIDFRALWHTSGCKLIFNEPSSKEVSTLDQFSKIDFHENLRVGGEKYEVHTICLDDLLDSYSAPEDIDYLSLDTEGSEFEILQGFDFTKRFFRCITCEHNYTDNRQKVYELLTSKGYVRKYQDFSGCDDWYFFKS